MAVRQPSTFAALLREYRISAGLTQEELAERANLSARVISDLERGVIRAPHQATLDLLIQALDLAPDERDELERSIQRRRGAQRVEQDVIEVRSSIPEPPTPLVGRQRDIAEAVHRLRWGGARLLTITGPGGVGKTRVAIAVARELERDMADGVLSLPLAPLQDAALVAVSLFRALDLRETSGQRIEDVLVDALRERDMLLVLDNFEHLLDAAHLVSRLLHECRQITVLVTSRTALRIQGEQRFELSPLEVPGVDTLKNLEIAGRYPAMELFLDRAKAVKRSFELTEVNIRAVVEISARLDGLPLAIELAAARINLLTPQALLMRLDQRLRALTEGGSDLPDRQQTMADTIAWSYYLLDEEGQRVLRQLSVFAGGWTLEAADAVTEHTDSVKWLGMLVDSSLVVVEQRDAVDGFKEPRYRMLETIREYAAERLDESGELHRLRRQHARYYLDLAEMSRDTWAGPEQITWLARLEADHDNLRAALRWAEETGETALGLRVAAALRPFWMAHGHLSEGRGWLEELLAQSRQGETPEVDALVRANALRAAGVLARQQGDVEQAQQLIEESLVLSRDLGDRAGMGTALNALGIIASSQGDYVRATGLYGESLALAREQGDRAAAALILSNLAEDATILGDYGRAAALHEEALALSRSLGWVSATGLALQGLGEVRYYQGDYARATALLRESLVYYRDTSYETYAAENLEILARVACAEGEMTRAARLLGAAAAMRDRVGAARETNKQPVYDSAVAQTRAALGDVTFSAAWAEGQAMDFEQALAYVLDRADT